MFYSFFVWLLFGISRRMIMLKLYALLLILVSFSRLYIAAHFPHQVVIGVIIGMAIGELCVWLDLNKIIAAPTRLLYITLALVALGVGVYALLWNVLGVDPDWSIELARKQ